MDIPGRESRVPVRIAGLDGCKGGWVAVIVEPDGSAHAERLAHVAELFERPLAPQIAAVDMPIGLPERVEAKGRAPERLVRPLLGGRQSSVFSIPSRTAVHAGVDAAVPEEQRYRHACAVARETSTPPKAVAKQAFHIFPKIVEIDLLLRAQPALQSRLFECHPEVAFWAMNGRTALDQPKKVKNAPHKPGLALRRSLLETAGFPPELISPFKARELNVGEDDLIDACAAAWTAGRIARHEAVSFPSPPERDAHGLPIAIWA
jgi:predicted RNase H-like nuclease